MPKIILMIYLYVKCKLLICDLFQDNDKFLYQQNSAECYVAAIYKRCFQDTHVPQLQLNLNCWDLLQTLTKFKI